MKLVISDNPFDTDDWDGIVLLLDCGGIVKRTVEMHKQENAASLTADAYKEDEDS